MGILMEPGSVGFCEKVLCGRGKLSRKRILSIAGKFSITSAKNEGSLHPVFCMPGAFPDPLHLQPHRNLWVCSLRVCAACFYEIISGASHSEISANAYIKEGDEAVRHLLTVASGWTLKFRVTMKSSARSERLFNCQKIQGSQTDLLNGW